MKKEIKKALNFAKLAHAGQKRLSGEDYITHPIAVAKILKNWKLDSTTVIAGILHDTIEEGGATREDLIKEFGLDIANLVDGVTKVTNLRLRGSKEQVFVESLRKMILFMAKDLRVVFVKLADRTHNMQTLSYLSKEKQIENARETLEIYAPLAERLGIGGAKSILEDLSFSYLYEDEYEKLKKLAKPYYKKAETHIDEMKSVIREKLKKEKIANAEIHGRKKHLYSLWRKLQRPEIDWDFEKIYDIVALRILVNSVPECYATLGIVHSIYKPVPKIGISDFIAQPKPNGYQSIHTKVFGPGGRIVEVQIRTFEMHSKAENGIAAHWAYADAKNRLKDSALEKGISIVPSDKLSWVKKLVEWQKEISDSEEFLRSVKFDAFQNRNFIFSPKGDVYDLPKDATPIDFAFAVHTQLGYEIESAKVNGKLVSLNEKLKSGDVVEIIKSKHRKGPSPDWLEFVVTTFAKREINRYLRKKAI
jgi:GTP pyrophosphokinase